MLKIGSILVSIMFISIGLVFAISTPEISDEKTETRALITGTVLDAETGDAIPLAEVTLSGTEISTTTDEYGVFSFDEIDAGNHTLTVEADGYESAEVEVDVFDEGANIEVELSPEM